MSVTGCGSGMDYGKYFEFRQVRPGDYSNFEVPRYLLNTLGDSKDARILDFGCGFGQLAFALRALGFRRVEGLDIAPAAIEHCRSRGLECHDGADSEFFELGAARYDFVVTSHVVEHFPKDQIIPLLERLFGILRPGGALVVIVPNAQSNTGAYWAYEDFTHCTLFTAGSLYYVLRAAGFDPVSILDPDALDASRGFKRMARALLLRVYRANYFFWNKVTGSAVHAPSEVSFAFEVKALGRRP